MTLITRITQGERLEMELTFEQVGTVGIFNFSGELTREYEDTLNMTLMKAIHSIDRAVLNFKKVRRIDLRCQQLLKQAYFTSVRLQNPLILINLHEDYIGKVSHHFSSDEHIENPAGKNYEYSDNGISKEEVCS